MSGVTAPDKKCESCEATNDKDETIKVLFYPGRFYTYGIYRLANGNKLNGYYSVCHGVNYMYAGNFVDGQYDGYGAYSEGNNSEIGRFKEGKFVFGSQLSNDGGTNTLFRGRFDEYGERTGKGVFKSADGFKYVGDFSEDHFDGSGVALCADGTKYEGKFKKGCFQDGVMADKDGTTFEGKFSEGYRSSDVWCPPELNGKYLATRPDGTTFRCVYENGKKLTDGPGKNGEEGCVVS